MDKELNVNRLYEICRRLVQEGKGDFPVVIVGRNQRRGRVEEITVEDSRLFAVAIDKSVREWPGE